MMIESIHDDVSSGQELRDRYRSTHARLMGPAPPPIRSRKPKPQTSPEPPQNLPPDPPPEPEPSLARNDNIELPVELPLPAGMPLEEKAAALLALVPTVGPGRLRRLLVITARAFDTSVRDLCGPSRRAQHVVPRQIAMVIALQAFGSSLPKVGRAFGGRDHTTVLHARNKFGDMVRGLIRAAIPPT